MRPHVNRRCVVALLVLLVVPACSPDGGNDDAAEPSIAASQTVTPTIIEPPSTHPLETLPAAPPTTVAGAPATVPPPTEPVFLPTDGATPPGLIAPLQTPITPPTDINADEPVLKLGSIEIPKIDVATPIFEGIRMTTFNRGAGHWPGTSMPGFVGNAVVGGHRTAASKPFRNLDQLVAGDEVIFNTVDGRFVYLVTGIDTVDPEAMEIVRQTLGFTATLFACHPPGSTDQRIVVYLELEGS